MLLEHKSRGVGKQEPPKKKLPQDLSTLTLIISEFTWVGTVESKSRMLMTAPRLPGDEWISHSSFPALMERSLRYVGSFWSWEGLLIKA